MQGIDEGRNSLFSRLFDLNGGAKKKRSSATPAKPKPSNNHAESHEHMHNEHRGTHGSKEASSTEASHPSKHNNENDTDHGDDGFTAFGGAGSDGQSGQTVDVLAMFQKLGYLYLLVFISIALATYLIMSPFIYKRFFDPDNNDDYNFDSAEATHASRYKKLLKFVFLYNVLIILCLLFVLLVIYGLVAIYHESAGLKSKGINVMQFYKQIMFSYNNHGNEVSLANFYLTFALVIVVGYLFYFIYFKYVVGYFTTLTFPSYIDTDKSESHEWDNPKKYIIMYALMLMYILAFCTLMILNYLYSFNVKVIFIWNIIFLFLMMFFMGMIVKHVLTKEPFLTFTWTAAYVILILANKNMGEMFKVAATATINMSKGSTKPV